jgi:hypothetical protein
MAQVRRYHGVAGEAGTTGARVAGWVACADAGLLAAAEAVTEALPAGVMTVAAVIG